MSGLDWLMIGSVLVINLISMYVFFTDKMFVVQKHNAEGEETSDNIQKPGMKNVIAYSIIFILVNLGMALMLRLFYTDNSFLFSLKRLCLLSVLWPVGFIDFKSYRIPNSFILLGFIYRLVVFIFEMFFEMDSVWTSLLSEGIAAAALALAAFLCSICIKNSIGYGDIKLFLVMGIFLGLNGIWNSIFVSLILTFIISVILLVTKKKSKKDVIPFAPAIMLGTYISVFLTGM